MTIYKWLNLSRYYTAHVEKCVNGLIRINYSWGGCYSNRGGKKHLMFETEYQVMKQIMTLMKRREKRGYILLASPN
jgi:predicted DNA-binding WGR domain protein